MRDKLLLVEWDDTTTHDGWMPMDNDYSREAMHIKSVGWKLKSSPRFLVLTPMKGDEGRCNDRQIIPRGCVRRVTEIKEPEDAKET